MSDLPSSTHHVTLCRGNIYLSRQVCDTYLPDAESVALVLRDDQVLIMPLIRQSGGGMLLKIRNSQGDRVIHAQEFFRDKGLLEDFEQRLLSVRWRSDMAALLIVDVPRSVDVAASK